MILPAAFNDRFERLEAQTGFDRRTMMLCEERDRLLEEYAARAREFSEAVERLAAAARARMSKLSYTRWMRPVDFTEGANGRGSKWISILPTMAARV